MHALVQTLPLSVLVQHPHGLTLRTLLQVALEPQEQAPRLRCRALGVLQLERGEFGNEHVRTAEAQGELLTFFLLQPRRFWTIEQIYDALWTQKELERAQWSFHSTRKRLREFAGEQVIVKLQRGQYGLNPHLPIWFDVAEFDKFLARSQQIANVTARINLLESAVQLYRGDLLEQNYKDWVMPVRTRMREKYIGALLQLGDLAQKQSPQKAIAWYEKALQIDDLNEDIYFKMIELYVQTNNRIAAQRIYVSCLDTLQREMGTAPSDPFFQNVRALLGDAGFQISLQDR
ncbi:MAG: hypothetical protein B6D41_00870 [Chloroflexi bacterium UTCFX4]|jgi:DNA-binding SARP family transcriptional activator|nr:MAG: hypothetical protein B6D41_00870 [Chloroflexi bacterium UTCFX4]